MRAMNISAVSYKFSILFLLIFSVVAVARKAQTRKNTIKFFLAAEDRDDRPMALFSRTGFYESIKNMKIEEFSFNNQCVLTAVDNRIRKLSFSKSTSIVKVSFTAQNTYGDFVSAVNVALRNKLKRYAYVDDALYLVPLTNP
jgi:hypothetical protein